jgi:uncharacterized protein YcbK (DUF882 family)
MLATTQGPSAHLTWTELACRDGSPYPEAWRETRAIPLAATFEAIRARLGSGSLYVNSAYRTPAYNARIGGAPASQHVAGRALDLRHAVLSAREVHARILALYGEGLLPLLGGLGAYPTFTHVDIRPIAGLQRWSGGGE